MSLIDQINADIKKAMKAIIQEVITQTGVSVLAEMGKVLRVALGKFQGKADGKLISNTVNKMLA